jgi:hypothetical protein
VHLVQQPGATEQLALVAALGQRVDPHLEAGALVDTSASSDIALLPEDCNRGIGTTLLRGLQSEAAASGKPLRIHVERFKLALRPYERLGFRGIVDRASPPSRAEDYVQATARPRQSFSRRFLQQPRKIRHRRSSGIRRDCRTASRRPGGIVRTGVAP